MLNWSFWVEAFCLTFTWEQAVLFNSIGEASFVHTGSFTTSFFKLGNAAWDKQSINTQFKTKSNDIKYTQGYNQYRYYVFNEDKQTHRDKSMM